MWMRIALTMLAAMSLAGCATIVEGTTENVTIATNPPGATCAVDRAGLRLGVVPVTPGSVRLGKSKDDLTITCARPGFAPAVVVQPAHFVYTTFGNVIAGGIIGVTVDAASGANYAYRPNVLVAMAPAPGGAPPASLAAAPAPLPPTAYPALPPAMPAAFGQPANPDDSGSQQPVSLVGTLPPLPPPEY
jgi:hypothetical protein